MLLAASSFASGLGIFLALFGIGYVLKSVARLAADNPEKAATCLKVARTFLKK